MPWFGMMGCNHARVFSNLKGVDFYIVAAPTSTHEAIGLQLAEAGVLCLTREAVGGHNNGGNSPR